MTDGANCLARPHIRRSSAAAIAPASLSGSRRHRRRHLGESQRGVLTFQRPEQGAMFQSLPVEAVRSGLGRQCTIPVSKGAGARRMILEGPADIHRPPMPWTQPRGGWPGTSCNRVLPLSDGPREVQMSDNTGRKSIKPPVYLTTPPRTHLGQVLPSALRFKTDSDRHGSVSILTSWSLWTAGPRCPPGPMLLPTLNIRHKLQHVLFTPPGCVGSSSRGIAPITHANLVQRPGPISQHNSALA